MREEKRLANRRSMNENDGNAEDYFCVWGGREVREKRCIKHNRMSEKTVAG